MSNNTAVFKMRGVLNSTLTLKRNWLYLALASIIIPGIAAVILVLLRTMEISGESISTVFRLSLVLHVDLSVYAWMVSLAALSVSLKITRPVFLEPLAFYLCLAGVGMISISPFFGSPAPVLSNYVPVINSPWFLAGLGLFSLGAALLFISVTLNRTADLLHKLLAVLYLTAFAISLHAGFALDFTQTGVFEYLFWGAGHVLQLMSALFLMFAWVMLLDKAYGNLSVPRGLLHACYVLMALPAVYAVYLSMVYEPVSPFYRIGMTAMMEWGHAAAPVLLSIIILFRLIALKPKIQIPPAAVVFYCSFILFTGGGLIGFLISGSNTIVPAHYHGSIVGVTLALMGLVYYYLPELGFSAPRGRMVFWQPIVYTLGQLMHVAGLAVTGYGGAARKTVGKAALADPAEIGTFLIRTGGLIAVIGGVMFIIVVIIAIRTTGGRKAATSG